MKTEPKKVTRNEYYALIRNTGKIPKKEEYEILPLDLSRFHLNPDAVRIADANFSEETENRNGFYMLTGHWMSNLCYSFAEKCKFDLKMVDGYSAYAYSDEQMSIFTYTEGDIYLTLFEKELDYKKEKEETIRFHEERF